MARVGDFLSRGKVLVVTGAGVSVDSGIRVSIFIAALLKKN